MRRVSRSLVLTLLLLVGGLGTPLTAYLLTGGTPGGSAPGAGDAFEGSTASAPTDTPHLSALAPVLAGLLSLETDLDAAADPLGFVEHLAARPPRPSSDPLAALRTLESRLPVDPATLPPRATAADLATALDAYAAALGRPGLDELERAAVSRLVPALHDDLTPLVNALTYATLVQEAAVGSLDPAARQELLARSARLLAQDAAAATEDELAAYEALAAQVDLGALVHAARVLTEASLEARDALGLHLAQGLIPPTPEPDPGRALARAGEVQRAAAKRPLDPWDPQARLAKATELLAIQADRPASSALDHGSLQGAVEALVAGVAPGAGATLDPAARTALDRLPPELSRALATVVLAYAAALDAERMDTATGGLHVLEALTEALPVLETWGYRLRSTPPLTHFQEPGEVQARVAGLALSAPSRASTVEGTLALLVAQAGLPARPAPALPPAPPLGEALEAWYAAFGIAAGANHAERARAIATLPPELAEALAGLLDAQVRAAGLTRGLALSDAERSLVARTAPVVHEVLAGAPASPDRAAAVHAFASVADPRTLAALEAATLLALATDHAHDVLARGPLAPPPGFAAPQSEHEDLPRADDPAPPAPPAAGGSAPGTPFSDPGTDTWFVDGSGLIRVTGYGRTTYPSAFHALTLDLGGDDTRPDSAGGAVSTSPVPFAIAIDLEGDDVYQSEDPYVQGSGSTLGVPDAFPVGILADYHGDDLYEAGPFSQGSGYMGGVGILFDVAGDDVRRVRGTAETPADFPVEGGQGYGFAASGLQEEIYLPALGALVDLTGADTYDVKNGHGAAIALGEVNFPTIGVRVAGGLLVEGTGADSYRCEDVCTGIGRFGIDTGLECGGRGGPCGPSPILTPANVRPGSLVSVGTFVDVGGIDLYESPRGVNDRVGPAYVEAFPMVAASGGINDVATGRAGMRVNVSILVDAGLTDSNGDGFPDLVATAFGNEPGDADDGPLVTPLSNLDPEGATTGTDTDGDGFTDAAEARLGTDPSDPRSRPIGLGAEEGATDKLVDLSVDLTMGTIVTGTGIPERGPFGRLHAGSPMLTSAGTTPPWGLDGLDTDGTVLPLLAVGDTVTTRWDRDYPLAFDLGGADEYANRAGAPLLPFGERELAARHTAAIPGLLVDLAGDDRYRAPGRGPAQGTGGAGTYGILVDVAGNDTYEADRGAQGAALGPGSLGALIDLAGRDRYLAEDAAQGYGAASCDDVRRHVGSFPCQDLGRFVLNCSGTTIGCGDLASKTRVVALLLDFEGNDTYEASGQAILDPVPLAAAAPCRTCTGPLSTVWSQYDSAVGFTNGTVPGLPTPGAATRPGSGGRTPAPLDREIDATGDAVALIDLGGSDGYFTRGFVDPETTQGFARGEGLPGQGAAFFLDAGGGDQYIQRGEGGSGDTRTFEKNNMVLIQGQPGTPSAGRPPAVFLDVDHAETDRDGSAFPDIVESVAGGRAPYEERGQDPRPVVTGTSGTFVVNLPRLGVLVGGTGKNLYNATLGLVVDLGGDDLYKRPVGTGRGDLYERTATAVGAAVAIDLGGHDRYLNELVDPGTSTHEVLTGAASGAGILGVGVLLDDGGFNEFNSTVRAKWTSGAPAIGASQGAGFQGVGVLITRNGTNRFLTHVVTDAPASAAPPVLGLGQGAAFSGVGLLFELGGDDRDVPEDYDPHERESRLAQRFAREDDREPTRQEKEREREERRELREDPWYWNITWRQDYYDLLVEPPAIALGAGQGFASEGLGLLVEEIGPNTFNATGAAQGAALGTALADRSVNPLLTARDWAIGALVSLGEGADRYRSTSLSQGAAQGRDRVGLLYEASGDDRYDVVPRADRSVPALSQGAGAAAGLGLLLDEGGDDVYRAGAVKTGVSGAQGASWNDESMLRDPALGPPPRRCQGTFPDRQCVSEVALGVLADLEGHDTYLANGTIAQGAALSINRVFAGTTGSSLIGNPHKDNRINALVGIGVLFELQGDDRYDAPGLSRGSDAGTKTTYVAGPRTADLHQPGLGLFLDAGGADRYATPHPSPVPLSTADCGGAANRFLCSLPPGGARNNEAWKESVVVTPGTPEVPMGGFGLGVDAPTIDLARERLNEALQVEASPVRAWVEADVFAPTCEEVPEEPAAGELCIELRVERAGAVGRLEVERVRVVAIGTSGATHPELIAEVREPDEEEPSGALLYRVPWDTSLPAFVDGAYAVRVQADLTVPTSEGRRHVSLTNETEVALDNPPWVELDAPRWFNPAHGGELPVTFRVLGETSAVSLEATLVCASPSFQNTTLEADPIEGGLWTTSWNVSACGGEETLGLTFDVNASDGRLHAPARPHAITLDREPPALRIEGPSSVNQTSGGSGGFTVRWTATDNGEPVSVSLEYNRGRNWVDWLAGLPPEGQVRWDGINDGDELFFRGTVVDAAGNQATSGGLRTEVDLSPPSLGPPRVVPQYVQSGRPVSFQVNASDERGLGSSLVEIDGLRYPVSGGGFGGGTVTLRYDGWSGGSAALARAHGDAASRPEGYPYRFLVRDTAGNLAGTVEGQVFIDDVPPVLEDARLLYPRGTAGGPGDLVTLLVQAQDELGLPATLSANVSNVSSTGEVVLRQDPLSGNYTGLFVLDRSRPGAAPEVHIAVSDLAGNTVKSVLPVAIATRAPTPSAVAVTPVTPYQVDLTWTTDVVSTGRVVLTDPGRGEQFAFETPLPAKAHELPLTGLKPATRYTGTLSPANAAGGTGSPHSFGFETPSAIHLDVLEPASGALLGASAVVSWNASAPGLAPTALTLTAVSTDPLIALERVLFDAHAAEAGEGRRRVDLTGLPDGPYELHLTAASGSDRNTRVLGSITVDHTAPVVRLLSPRPGDVVGAGTVTVRAAAVDALSELDPDTAVFELGESAVRAELAEDGTLTALVNLTGLSTTTLFVGVADVAGNLARDGGPLFVDADGPRAGDVNLELPPGQHAVKPGDRLSVVVPTAPDDLLVGVLERSSLSEELRLARGAKGLRAVLEVPGDAPEGLHEVTVRLSDPAGNARRVPLDLPVDATPPRITEAVVDQARETRAILSVCANEPVRLHAAATELTAPEQRTSSDVARACHALVLEDLWPSRTYVVRITAVDGAGHTAVSNLHVTTAPDEIAPRGVANLWSEAGADGVVALAWLPARDDIGLQGYRIYRAEAGGAPRPIGLSETPRFLDGSVVAGTAYQYTVHALDRAGNEGAPSPPLDVRAPAAPRVLSAGVSPPRGGPDTLFTYTLSYRGPWSEDSEAIVVLDGVARPLERTEGVGDCNPTCTFSYRTKLAPESLGGPAHDYRFEIRHAGFAASEPAGGAARGPIVTIQEEARAGGSALLLGAGVLAGLAAVTLVATAIHRRRTR